MKNLQKIIFFKIVFTLLFWCIPLIFFQSHFLEAIGFPPQHSNLFIHLLGFAYFALCVGYSFALNTSLNGTRPVGAIWMGIVSNGGAFFILMYYGISGAWSDWEYIAKIFFWISALITLLITAGLYLYGIKEKS